MKESNFLQKQAQYSSGQGTSARILVVEDDADIQHVLCVYLEHSGFEVRAVSDGEKAIAAIPDFCPDLIVLDLMMSPVDGWEVLRWLRARRSVAAPPVLVLTALTQLEEQVHGFEAGAIEYLTKPTQPGIIVERIRKILALSSEQRDGWQRERKEQPRETLRLISAPQPDEFIY